MVITAGAANRMSLAGKVPVIRNTGMHDSDKLPGKPGCSGHAVAPLSGKTGEVEPVSCLLPVMSRDEPRTQTSFRPAHGSGIFSKSPGLTSRSYPAHLLETYPAPTGPA